MTGFPKTLMAAAVAALLASPATALADGKHKRGHKHHGPPAAAWQHDRYDRYRRNSRFARQRHLPQTSLFSNPAQITCSTIT